MTLDKSLLLCYNIIVLLVCELKFGSSNKINEIKTNTFPKTNKQRKQAFFRIRDTQVDLLQWWRRQQSRKQTCKQWERQSHTELRAHLPCVAWSCSVSLARLELGKGNRKRGRRRKTASQTWGFCCFKQSKSMLVSFSKREQFSADILYH